MIFALSLCIIWKMSHDTCDILYERHVPTTSFEYRKMISLSGQWAFEYPKCRAKSLRFVPVGVNLTSLHH